MSYDKKAYDEWAKQFPDATDSEKETVKSMYSTDGKGETDAEVVVKQGNDSSPKLDKAK